MSRALRTIIPTAVAAAVVLALPVAAVAAAAPAAVPGETGAQTTITMNVTGCEGCTIQANQFVDDTTPAYQSKSAVVTGGVATLTVPTANTKGMYFSIQTAKPARINALPLITTQVKGHPAGSTLSRGQQVAGKKASACWAGTSDAAVTIAVTVNRVKMPSFPNGKKKTLVPLARFAPTVKALGGFSTAYKGVLATQDVWPCANS